VELHRATYRVRGDVIDIYPADSDSEAVRIELFDDEVDSLSYFDPLTGEVLRRVPRLTVYPKTHYVTPRETLLDAVEKIKDELKERLEQLNSVNKLVEAQRLEQRTQLDIEMIMELGYCSGIENYSRYLSGREVGEAPPTFLDYLPDDALLFIDESHVTVSQVGAMYKGDRSRKENLVEYGFRLPSALDNRPLQFQEFEQLAPQTIFISATPGNYESEKSMVVAEQIVRPTGLTDPPIEIRGAITQVDDLLSEINKRVAKKERILVTTLTKRMAEDLTDYYLEHDVKVRYLHSDIDTVERVEIIRDLRLGEFDVLVGINLLREGLDIPEVSLVAILDADKEGFLRSERSLIQTMGRAARHVNGEVILYAEKAMGNGVIDYIDHVIFVKNETFDTIKTEEMAAEIEQLNKKLSRQGLQYILIGPGRWGTRDRFIGIPVNWTQISSAKVIVETELKGFPLDASYGSHFFHNLTTMNIAYFSVYNDYGAGLMNYEILESAKIVEETKFFKHVQFDNPVEVKIDGKKRIAVINRKN